ncbi:MAG: FMN-binding protein [Acidimicrobiaceae bacterium]|nr:FMN-binding protein [Acidimicrobiaceae bacterium]
MKRSPIVAVGTVVGLASVLSFHSSPAKISLSAATGVSTTQPVTTTTKKQTTTTAPATTTTTARTTTTQKQSSTGATTTAPATTTTAPAASTTTAPATTTTVAATGVRSATGPSVNYYFGVLSVKVTANGKKITAVTIGTINDGGNPRSVQVDQYAIPILEQEAVAAQSSNIQSVSGASYTSAGFQMSLQYALKHLGI